MQTDTNKRSTVQNDLPFCALSDRILTLAKKIYPWHFFGVTWGLKQKMPCWLTFQNKTKMPNTYNFPPLGKLCFNFQPNLTSQIVWSVLIMAMREKMTWPGSAALSMIGECRWVLQCFPYRHWTSSPPLKAAATASPDTSCTEPQFSEQATICRREGGDKMR